MPAIANDGIRRSYALLLQAEHLLHHMGQTDIAVFLYHPLGLLEDRFGLLSSEADEAINASKKALS